MPRLQRHVFVCVNQRPAGHPKGCCVGRGGLEVREALTRAAHEAGLGDVVRINKAGCLDVCRQGAAVVVYPDQVWYGGVTTADAVEIVESHLLRGVPVQRLRIDGEDGRAEEGATDGDR